MFKLAPSVLFVAFILLLAPPAVLAEASFEGTQNGVLRKGFQLFGGQIADIDVDSSGRVYAAASAPNGIFCLASGQSEWSDPPAGSNLGNPVAVAVGNAAGTAFVLAGVSLFRTTDGCLSWTELTGSTGSVQGNDFGFQLAVSGSSVLVESRDGTLDRSIDNGATFTKSVIASGVEDVVAIASSPTAGEFYALAKASGTTTLYRSTDSGGTWTSVSSGQYVDVAVDPLNPARIAVATEANGAAISVDSGATFTSLNAPPTSKQTVIFINSKLYKGSAFSENLTDWSLLSESTTGADIVAPVSGDPTSTSTLYVGTELGVAKSTDSGATFSDLIQGMYAIKVHDIAQGTDKNIVYLGTEQGLAKTTNFLNDAGPAWTQPVPISASRAYQAVYSIQIDATDENRLYAGLLGGELYYSADGGSTWSASSMTSIGGADILDIEQLQDGTLFAAYASRDGNSGGVLRSTDRGQTWTTISTGSFDVDCNALAGIDNVLLAGAGDDVDGSNPAGGIYRYAEGVWSKVEGVVDGEVVTALAVADKIVLAASAPRGNGDAAGAVFRSTDRGQTWKDVTSKGLREETGWYRTLAVDPKNKDIIFAAHGRPAGAAEIYYSQDRGATWALYYSGLIDEVPAAMLVDDLTTGSGIGFTGIEVNKTVLVKQLINKRNVLVTVLKDQGAKLSGQKISLERQKGKSFVRMQTKTTNDSGKATFNLKNLKPGTKVRSRFLTEVSRLKQSK